MDLQRLRQETRPEHEATEASMPLMAPDLSLATYVEVLRRLYPVLASWERWSQEHAPAAVQPLLTARQRSPLLAEDLRNLGAPEPDAARTTAPVDWDAVVGDAADGDGEARYLGALYVLEGSTLGGRFIARHVQEALHLEPGRGNAYFQGHGDATGRMWRETTALLAGLPEETAPAVIAAARRTFQAFGKALAEPALMPDVDVATHSGATSTDVERPPSRQTAS